MEASMAARFFFAVLALGVALAFLTALVPHYDAGHRLAVDVLMVGLLPYLLYGMSFDYLDGWRLVLPGAAVLALDLAVKLPAWWRMDDGTIPEALYTLPSISSALVIVLVVALAWRRGDNNAA
jgi:hypothetical protein